MLGNQKKIKKYAPLKGRDKDPRYHPSCQKINGQQLAQVRELHLRYPLPVNGGFPTGLLLFSLQLQGDFQRVLYRWACTLPNSLMATLRLLVLIIAVFHMHLGIVRKFSTCLRQLSRPQLELFIFLLVRIRYIGND